MVSPSLCLQLIGPGVVLNVFLKCKEKGFQLARTRLSEHFGRLKTNKVEFVILLVCVRIYIYIKTDLAV